ncbi:FxsA family protein [Chitinimonas prasina]|uniref:FxsA family protein n=1 Tax=Chitinimonas prasina TaxID=1434937 RepID=UPI0024E0AEF0|nr:FxsA family protein [Chitinimonas prasina]
MLLRLLPIFGLLLLGLPVLELVSSIWLASQIGWWLAFWLFASALIGVGILKSWRLTTAWAMVDGLRQGELPLGRLFWVGRTLIAALLFIFPGPVSDVIGLILILPWPGIRSVPMGAAAFGQTPFEQPGYRPDHSANSSVFEGEYSRVDEAAPKLPRQPQD